MKKSFTGLLILFLQVSVFGQSFRPIKISMTADKWSFPQNGVEFMPQYKGAPAFKVLADTVRPVLKDVEFSSGTIEYDVESMDGPFTGIYFRRQSYEESEYFYLRTPRAGNPLAIDAVQYAPWVKGVLLWDLLGYYQAPAIIKKGEWNHVKLVVSGQETLIYVNDMSRAALQIPHLEGNTKSGGIGFYGKCIFANLVITPGEVNGLPPAEGFDPTYHDSRYLRNWLVNEPSPFPFGKDVAGSDVPVANTNWQKLIAERRGLVNLTRQFGPSRERRIVWLKTTIKSDKEQIRKLSLGFSDEVWVLINGRAVYIDKNWYGDPIAKEPDGRCDLENATFNLPLKAGDNEIMIGVANNFFGWGIIARLDKLDGISY